MKEQILKFIFRQNIEKNHHSNGRFNGKHTASSLRQKKRRSWKESFLKPFSNQGNPLKYLTAAGPLTTINRALFVLAIILTILAPLFLWYDSKVLATHSFDRQIDDNGATQKTEISNKSSHSFAPLAARRRYFRTNVRESVATAVDPLNAADIPGLAQRFTLLGVLMGDNPQAIVRENSSNTTLFLNVGQKLDGYLVQEIFSDRILLKRDGDLVNLRM